jgi:hypothetical protein
MSSISAAAANSGLYQPVASPANPSKPATIAAQKNAAATKAAATKSDPDGDGDTDGPGLDVKG